jgi:hypothetical protein
VYKSHKIYRIGLSSRNSSGVLKKQIVSGGLRLNPAVVQLVIIPLLACFRVKSIKMAVWLNAESASLKAPFPAAAL